MVHVAKAMSKYWLILTVVGVDKNFPEGIHIKFVLRGSTKLSREKEKILKTGIGNFNKYAESGKCKEYLGSKIMYYR